jgi:hypothetical protein
LLLRVLFEWLLLKQQLQVEWLLVLVQLGMLLGIELRQRVLLEQQLQVERLFVLVQLGVLLRLLLPVYV